MSEQSADPPVLSVVIPTFNRAAVLPRLFEALAACDPPAGGVEFIVVDDGSSDDTAAVVARAEVPGLVSLRQDNAGAAAARNLGWRHARGALIAFTDDDCIPSRRWMVELVDAFHGSDLAAVGGAVVPFVPGFLAEFIQAERMVSHGGDADAVKYLVTANAAFTRDALEAVGGFDERFPGAAGEDTDLTFRIQDCQMRITLIEGATVAHDHRTTMRGLFRTYYRHGRAWLILAQTHPDRELGIRSTSMATATYWRQRYAYYRDERASKGAAVVYCGLRLAGLTFFATGMARESLAARRTRRH